MVRNGAALLVLLVLLIACISLPREAEEAALRSLDPDQQPRIRFARPVDLLREDEEAGADEVWCVNVAFRCWSRSRGEWHTCASSFLVRHVDGGWETVEMATREDWERWEARGCPREPELAERVPRCPYNLADATDVH